MLTTGYSKAKGARMMMKIWLHAVFPAITTTAT
jgi:hypothetical protein